MPFVAKAPPRVQPFFGFRNEHRLIVSVRALRSREPVFEKRSVLGDMLTIIGQYTSKEVPAFPVELEYTDAKGARVSHKTVTGPEGFAHFEIDLPSRVALPDSTVWETAKVVWAGEDGSRKEAIAHILAPGSEARFGIISDIDDTILETGITGNIRAIARNWKRIILQMPEERTMVPGVQDFYAALGGDTGRLPTPAKDAIEDAPKARIRPTFYVSSSPWNLFSYLVTFKKQRGLPLGPIMLRDWGLNRRTLGSKGHGSHKLMAVQRIISECPHLTFVLVGDDSQKDLFAFAEIAQTQPDRIAAVCIRSVVEDEPRPDEIEAHKAIASAGVPFWTGSNYREARAFLESNGIVLTVGDEALIETVGSQSESVD